MVRCIIFFQSSFFWFLMILSLGCERRQQTLQEFLLSDSAIIHGHTVSSEDSFSRSTVGLAFQNKDGQWKVACSGTLIGKRVVLTAAHCESLFHKNEASILFGFSEDQPIAHLPMKAWVNHPDYTQGSGVSQYHDLAVILLSQDAPAGYAPIKIYEGEKESLRAGQKVVLAGYGRRFLYSDDVPNGVKKSGVLMSTLTPVAQWNLNGFEFQTDERESGSCQMDSGGPAFLIENGEYYLIGVTSRGDIQCKEYGVYTYAPAYQNWISNFL